MGAKLTTMANDPKKMPLTARVSKGRLVIEIGVDTLAHAYLFSEHAWQQVNPGPDGNIRPDDVCRVATTKFAREVVAELTAEIEDGSSILTRMLDEACGEAVDRRRELSRGSLQGSGPPKAQG